MVRGAGPAPVEHVQQLDLEADAPPVDDDVLVVQVAVVLAHVVDGLDAGGQPVQQVQPLEPAHAPAGLALEELGQQLALHVVGDQHGDGEALVLDRLLGVVLDQDRALPQLVQLLGVEAHGAVGLVALGEEELGRPFDAGRALLHQVDLALPAAAQAAVHHVLAGQLGAGLEVEGMDPVGAGLLGHAHLPVGVPAGTPAGRGPGGHGASKAARRQALPRPGPGKTPKADPGGSASRRLDLVEAAGIEPASVTGTPPASTCLVPCHLTCREARERAPRQASPTFVSPCDQRPASGLDTEKWRSHWASPVTPRPGNGQLS